MSTLYVIYYLEDKKYYIEDNRLFVFEEEEEAKKVASRINIKLNKFTVSVTPVTI